nr:tRNA-dihydrouridine synthase [Angustibacter aerolatus]
MVTSRALVERSPESMRLIEHGPGEWPRSVQLYGVDPATVGAAVRLLVDEDRADHVDLNFGCPVPKVTRKGGGAALPWKSTLFRDIVRAAVRAATPAGVPVTVKMRVGVDPDHLTYLDAGRAAEDEGVAAVALHGRTAAQHYSGHADWTTIARLKQAVTSIPVLGNGDVWSADDALRMVAETGCDGVVVGRGCLGRPWLFADLAAAFAGHEVRVRPSLGDVAGALRRHAEPAGGALRAGRLLPQRRGRAAQGLPRHPQARRLVPEGIQRRAAGAGGARDGRHDGRGSTTAWPRLDLTQPWPGDPAEGQRGRAGSPQRVALPEQWLATRELVGESARVVREAEPVGQRRLTRGYPQLE